MKKSSKTKKESTSTSRNKRVEQPPQSPPVNFKVTGRADAKQVEHALELLLTEWVRQVRADWEKE